MGVYKGFSTCRIWVTCGYTLNYMHYAFSLPFCAFLCGLVTKPRGFLAQMVPQLHGTVTPAITGPVTSAIPAPLYIFSIHANASGSREVPGGLGTH